MDQEIPLPPPRRVRHRSPSKPLDQSLRAPKRPSRLSISSFPSSDPAFFSSDDIPSSSLENYHGQHPENSKKRRYRGTWWGEKAMEAKRKRADFREKRHLDSGVWMGSDESSSECLLSSESSSCDDFFGQAQQTTLPVVKSTTKSNGSEHGSGPAFVPRNTRKQDEPKAHQAARALVNDCLEQGQDSIDLSGLVLRILPSDLLRPLLHLTKQPPVTAGPVTDEVFTSLTPFLRVFLSANSLTQLTSELFELGNLKVLSLRNNKLREIPSAIRRLTELQEVNLSVNRLNTLPWEMLWLIRKGDLKHMIVQPNPLFSLHEATDIEQWHYGNRSDSITAPRLCEYEGPVPEEAWAPIHIATSRVQYMDSEGNRLSDIKSRQLRENTSRVPSLRELALLECNRAPYLDQFLEEDLTGYPELAIRLLRQATAVRDAGGMTCSICHRSCVIPRTEWMEWWDCTTYENGLKGPRASGAELRPLPFLRRGCSWGCVPTDQN
ncbi:hypothetical protein BGW36DRAFT_301713 [Talaromyces proteolyticus]|uniref:Leucine rich repeat domain protein n=1 Tax=Talaromyces proteolyticus TaxID=1131652 RepID=A0AAD4KJW8_9EURO|nr:uncharacterized protein BGW36DRAFT_301713 [Talaromyces proteolyticus]KAH8692951.1 hypothetical protein BGW36DRAFT_301713 [Talaromyces proteolyticus]